MDRFHKQTMRRGLASLGAVLAVGLIGAACGSSGGSSPGSSTSNGEAGKSATQILSDAQAATSAATSVQISGSITSGTPVQLNVADGHGSGGGYITASGASFDVILAGTEVYIKADAAAWRQVVSATVAQQVAGKWIKTASSNPNFADFAKLFDISVVASLIKPTGTISKGVESKLNGVSVISLIDNGKNHGTLYIATTGQPYIIGLRGGGTNQGLISFGQYNSAKIPAAPAGAVDLNSLSG